VKEVRGPRFGLSDVEATCHAVPACEAQREDALVIELPELARLKAEPDKYLCR
jgi:hypothetical protein